MPMHSQCGTPGKRPVQKDVVRTEELGAADDLDAEAEYGAAVDGVGVRIAGAEGGEACAGAVEALLVVGLLAC
jgi:hypothetical protein